MIRDKLYENKQILFLYFFLLERVGTLVSKLIHPFHQNIDKSNSTTWAMRVDKNLPRAIRCRRILLEPVHSKKTLTLKMKVKVMEYNIHNGHVRWQKSASVKVIHFCQLLPFSRYSHFKIPNIQMQVKVMMYSSRSGIIRLQIPDFLSDGNSNVCYISQFLRY